MILCLKCVGPLSYSLWLFFAEKQIHNDGVHSTRAFDFVTLVTKKNQITWGQAVAIRYHLVLSGGRVAYNIFWSNLCFSHTCLNQADISRERGKKKSNWLKSKFIDLEEGMGVQPLDWQMLWSVSWSAGLTSLTPLSPVLLILILLPAQLPIQ